MIRVALICLLLRQAEIEATRGCLVWTASHVHCKDIFLFFNSCPLSSLSTSGPPSSTIPTNISDNCQPNYSPTWQGHRNERSDNDLSRPAGLITFCATPYNQTPAPSPSCPGSVLRPRCRTQPRPCRAASNVDNGGGFRSPLTVGHWLVYIIRRVCGGRN